MDTPARPDLHHVLRQTLAEHGGVRLAILFGSHATGRATPRSDLDLAVRTAAPLTATTRFTLIEKLAEATGLPVDLIDLERAGEPLLGQILKHGIRLLGSDEAYAALLTRHVFDAADFLPYRDRILSERRLAWIGK
jgi:predicted nucleotidyltransferase